MREAFSRIGSRIWCDANSLGVLLICAALVGRRVFLFTAAAVAIARSFRRGDTHIEQAAPETVAVAVEKVRTTLADTAFQPPRGNIPAELPDLSQLRAALERVVVGQAPVVEALMLGLIAGGHVLLEGAPGLGKTLACSTIACAVHAAFSRIQCHADLTPGDVVGCEVFDQRDVSFKFRPGPVFANVLLVDEINRAPARVQAALLEAMEERTVTIGTETHAIPIPFFVLATMNEAEADGIFPLPAAQLDRFLLKVVVDFPNAQEDLAILERRAASAASPVAHDSLDSVLAWQTAANAVYCAPRLLRYVTEIVRATRAAAESGDLESGAGPRAGLAILQAARAAALLAKRNYVLPADVRRIAPNALRHRVTFARSYLLTRAEREQKLCTILDRLPVP